MKTHSEPQGVDDSNIMGDSLHTALHDICMLPVRVVLFFFLLEVKIHPPSASFLVPYDPLGVELAASAREK